MHNEYRIYGWRRARSQLGARRGGYVAGNLIAAFVTGADGNFDAVIHFFIPLEFDSIFCFYFMSMYLLIFLTDDGLCLQYYVLMK